MQYVEAGTGVSYTYDAYGNQIASTDENLNTTSATYDEFRRRRTQTTMLGHTTTFDYDELIGGGGCCGGGGGAENRLTTITLPSGKKTHFQYDAAAQKTAEISGFGTAEAATTTFTYNTAGQVISQTDPRGKIWSSTFDLLNRRKTSTDPMGNTTTWNYDLAGNVLSIVRPDGGTTVNTYDTMNRVLTTKDPANQTTTFAYGRMAALDGGTTLHKMTDARGQVHTFYYDLNNRKTVMQYPDASSEGWTFDGAGNVTTSTTRGGQVKTCTYDARNRDVLCDWSDSTPDVAKTYDAAGRLLTMTSSVSALTYTYDNDNRLTSEKQDLQSPVDLAEKTVSYTYDADGNRATMVYPDSTVVSYAYTARNQVASISAGGPPPLASYSYDLAGNRTGKALENGTTTAYAYDNAGRLLTVDHKLSGVSFQKFDYNLNAVGNRTSRTETNAGSPAALDAYAYDPTDQVTQARYNVTNAGADESRKTTYAYDPVGNRTSVVEDADGTGAGTAVSTPYTANNVNQYTSIDGLTPPTYDTRGNITTLQTALGAPIWTYAYDAQNRLISVSGTNGTTASMAYDARNRCVARTITPSGGTATTTLHLWDSWNLIEERTPADVQTVRTIHGAAIDEILAQITSTGASYHHHDGLGSVTTLTGSSGAVIETTTYDIYGTPTLRNNAGSLVSTSTAGNRYQFTGREYLADLQIYDYRNRAYSAELGRFLQTDPIRLWAGDANIYRYVGNSPLSARDPLGLLNYDKLRSGLFNVFVGIVELGAVALAEGCTGGLATAGVATLAVSGVLTGGKGIAQIFEAFQEGDNSSSMPTSIGVAVTKMDFQGSETVGVTIDLVSHGVHFWHNAKHYNHAMEIGSSCEPTCRVMLEFHVSSYRMFESIGHATEGHGHSGHGPIGGIITKPDFRITQPQLR